MKKILSMALVFAMLSSLCLTAFAAPSFVDKTNENNKYFFLPIANEAVHYSYAANDDGGAEVSYETSHSVDAPPVGFSINESGVIAFTADAKASTSDFYRMKAISGGASIQSRLIYTYAPYATDFENATVTDGTFSDNGKTYFSSVQTVTEDGNTFIKGSSSGRARYKHGVASSRNNIVMDMDVKYDGNYFAIYMLDGPQTLTEISGDILYCNGTQVLNHPAISHDWHNVKVVMHWDSLVYSVFFDDVLVANSVTLLSKDSGGSSSGWYIYTSGGIDNFKYYGSSLDVAHSLTVSGTAKEGETLTASALRWQGDGLVPSTLEYVYLTADSADGEYSQIATGNTYTVADGLGGKYIKSAVRVKESDNIYGEWIYSEPQIVATATKPFAWTDKISDIYAPHGNDVYKFLFTHTGGGDNKTVIHGGTTTGMALADREADGYVLTVTSDAGAAAVADGGRIQTQIISRANTDGRAYVNIKDAGIRDFEDGSATGFSAYPQVMTEDNGNKYLSHTKYVRYTFPTDISDTVAIDFDLLTETMSHAYVVLDNGQQIPLINLWGNPMYKDMNSADYYTTVPNGWNHVRIYVDLTDKVYSMFINGKPLSVNNEIPGYDDDVSAKLGHIDFYASIDNFTFANVTPVVPVAYNAHLGNIAALRQNFAGYDFYLGGTPDKCTLVQWYVSDSFETGYTLVSEDKAFTPTADMVGKYVKARITPASEAFFETFTGAAVDTRPQLITDVAIGDITLEVDGADADITKANIADQTAGVTNTIALTIPASSLTNGKKVLFALAQYDNDGLCAVDSQSATLGASVQNIPLTLTASGVGETTYFKLLVFDEATLTPLQNVIFLR